MSTPVYRRSSATKAPSPRTSFSAPSQKNRYPLSQNLRTAFTTPNNASNSTLGIADSARTSSEETETDSPCPKRRKVTVKLEAPSNSPKVISTPKKEHSIYNTIIFIQVGPDKEEFGIHQNLLYKESPIFKDLVEGTKTRADVFLDADNNKMILPDEDLAVFTRFNNFLYSSALTIGEETVKDLDWAIIIGIYLFSTHWDIRRLHNKCIDTVIRKQVSSHVLPSPENITRLFKSDSVAANLRELFLHLFAYKCNLDSAVKQNGTFHRRFLQGLVSMLYQIREGKMVAEMDFWKRREKYYVGWVELD